MKQRLLTMVLVMMAIIMGACTNENVAEDSGISGSGQLTFILPANKGAVTYSRIANPEEDKVDLTTLKIYMFDAADNLERIYTSSDFTNGASGANKTVTLNVASLSGTGLKTFYFVGNGAGFDSNLPNSTGMSIADFSKLLITEQASSTHLTTPLLLTGKSSKFDPNGRPSETVKLARRVARIDIDNSTTITGVTINKIIVSKANLSGYVFHDNGTEIPTVNTDKLPIIDFTSFVNSVDPNSENPNQGQTNSVLYLYPTKVDALNTRLEVSATVNGVERLYPVNNVELKANYRYILRVRDGGAGKLVFELEVDDWYEGGDIDAKEKWRYFRLVKVSTSSPNWYEAGRLLDVTNTTQDEVVYVTVKSHRSEHYFEIMTNNGILPEPTVEKIGANELTYGGAVYEQAYKITFPNSGTITQDDWVRVVFRDKLDPDKLYEAVGFYSKPAGSNKYPGTNYDGVEFLGLTWAPVNVGAWDLQNDDNRQRDNGYLFQFGRNTPFIPQDIPIEYRHMGKVTLTESETTYKDEFLVIAGDYTLVPNGGHANSWMVDFETNPTKVWSLDTDCQGPCPEGWRLITKAEATVLSNYIRTLSDVDRAQFYEGDRDRYRFDGSNGTHLFFETMSGFFSDRSFYNPNITAIWTSSLSPFRAYRLAIGGKSYPSTPYITNVTDIDGWWGRGYSVRCVKQ